MSQPLMMISNTSLPKEKGYGEITCSDVSPSRQAIDKEIRDTFAAQAAEAKLANLISNEEEQCLNDLVATFIQAFGSKQEVIRMSTLDPMEVKLKEGAKPFKAEPRVMAFEKAEAMRNKIVDLLNMEMMDQNINPYFASAAMMVDKPGGDFRFVVDLREVNERVEPMVNILPSVEMQLSWLPSNIKFYCSLDCLSGFDMLRVEESAADLFGVSTPFGVFRLKGSPQGFINTPTCFQERVSRQILGTVEAGGIFGRRPNGALLWIDDIILYASSFEELMKLLMHVLRNCVKFGLRLSAKKCKLISNEAVFCGRRLTALGWNFVDKYWDKIRDMPVPKTLSQLEDVVYITTWLMLAIPKLADYKGPLEDLMNQLKSPKKLGKKARMTYNIEPYMTDELLRKFEELKSVIATCAKQELARSGSSGNLVLITDASVKYWSAVLAVEKEGTDEKDLDKVAATLMVFYSGKFSGSSFHWSVPCKELYPF